MLNGLGVLIPLAIGIGIGFALTLTISTPRRRPTVTAAPRPQRAAPPPRPAAEASPQADEDRRAEIKRLRAELAAAQKSAAALAQDHAALVAEHERALARRDKSIQDHKAEVAEQDARMQTLREQVAALGGRDSGNATEIAAGMAGLKDDLVRAQTAAAAAQSAVGEREQRLAAVHKELASVREELSAVRKRSGELSRSVEELTPPLFAERNRQIAQLEAALRDANAELARRPLVAAPAAAVDPSAAEKAANARVLAAYKHDMALQEEAKAALRRELAKRDAQIRELTGRAPAMPNGAAHDEPAVERTATAKPSDSATATAKPSDSATATAKPSDSATALAAKPARSGRTVASDDLKVIKGIGPVYARLLEQAGIRSLADLAVADPERLAAAVTREGGVPPDVAPWIDEARSYAARA
ncbi:MAG: DUF4332 domain-containing protein [Anaerolineae bacterium]